MVGNTLTDLQNAILGREQLKAQERMAQQQFFAQLAQTGAGLMASQGARQPSWADQQRLGLDRERLAMERDNKGVLATEMQARLIDAQRQRESEAARNSLLAEQIKAQMQAASDRTSLDRAQANQESEWRKEVARLNGEAANAKWNFEREQLAKQDQGDQAFASFAENALNTLQDRLKAETTSSWHDWGRKGNDAESMNREAELRRQLTAIEAQMNERGLLYDPVNRRVLRPNATASPLAAMSQAFQQPPAASTNQPSPVEALNLYKQGQLSREDLMRIRGGVRTTR